MNPRFLIQIEDIKKNYEDEKQKNLAKVDFTGKRVLLVDDIQVNRMISAKLLEKSGFAVETAENGQEAVDKVKDANAFAEDKKRALDAGMKGHIAKPIDIKNLLDTLSEILS